MAKIDRSIVIEAPWQAVDQVATDPNTHVLWFEGIEEASSDGNYPQQGSKIHYTYKAAGATFSITAVVSSYAHGDHLTVNMDGMITGVQHWQYERGANNTTLRVSFDYQVPGGGLGKIADKLIIERVNTSNLEKSLENLKRLVESGK